MGMIAVSQLGIVHSIDEIHQVARMMMIKIYLLKSTVDSTKFLQITKS